MKLKDEPVVWCVPFKIEVFGRAEIKSLHSHEAVEIFEARAHEEMLKDGKVFRPKVLGVYEKESPRGKKGKKTI